MAEKGVKFNLPVAVPVPPPSQTPAPPPPQPNAQPAGTNEDLERSKTQGDTKPEVLTPAGISEQLTRELQEAGKIKVQAEFEFKADEADIITEVDSDDGGRKKIYAHEYISAFSLLRSFIYLTFPFNIIKNADRSYIIASTFSTVGGMGFLISTSFITVLFILTWLGMFSYFLEVPRQESHGVAEGTSKWNGRAEEIFLLHRNFPTFIIFLTSSFHIVVANWQFFVKRVDIGEYLTFWTEALQIMKIHSAKGVPLAMTIMCGLFALFLGALIAMGVLHLAPVITGGPGFVAHLILRIFWRDFYITGKAYGIARAAFGVVFLYIFFASKLYVFLYIFKCLIMKHTFFKWSSRLDQVVNRDDDFIVRDDRLGKRTGFKELYQDHVVLLDLIDGADMMFGETIESYFTATTFSLCFECFYLWRALTNKEEFPDERALDAAVIGIYLLQSITVLFVSASLSADVADAAMEGLEVLRRKGFFGRKSGEELYFLMSLYASYSGTEVTALSGSGYFVLDQSFIVTIVGTFLSYVIILFQFNPPMEFSNDRLVPLILDREKLLATVEEKSEFLVVDSSQDALLMDGFTEKLYQDISVANETIKQMMTSFSF